jgi:DNA-binding transcriptional MerR regulator
MTVQAPFDFADGKDPEAFRTIGEVAQAFGLRQHVLRYWEEQFPMLKPLKRSGGRRYYRPEDVHLVAEISRLLYQEGFTIRGARQALAGKAKGSGSPPAEPVLATSPALEPERRGEEFGQSHPSPDFDPAHAGRETLAEAGALSARLRQLRDQLAHALQEA